LDIRTGQVLSFEEVGEERLTRRGFPDKDLPPGEALSDMELKETPSWDLIFDYQLHSDSDGRWETREEDMMKIEAMFFGRMLFPVGDLDNWAALTQIIGLGGTGKTTVLKVLKSWFCDGEVGTFSAKHETTFGLQQFIQNRNKIVVVNEISSDFHKTLDSTTMQQMVEAGEISIAVKNGTAKKVRWTMPLILAGNKRALWPTEGGSVTRRVSTLPFANKIPEEKKDLDLDRKLEEESHTIFLRCVRNYHQLREVVGSRNLTKFIPRCIADQKEVDTASYCVVANFVQNGSSGRTVMYSENGDGMTVKELQHAIRTHLERQNRNEREKVSTPSIEKIKSALATNDNVRVQQYHVCKRVPQRSVPGQPYLDHYNEDDSYCKSHRCIGKFYCTLDCRRTRDNCPCGTKNRQPLYWIHGLVLRANWKKRKTMI
jgi:hypothetical protein